MDGGQEGGMRKRDLARGGGAGRAQLHQILSPHDVWCGITQDSDFVTAQELLKLHQSTFLLLLLFLLLPSSYFFRYYLSPSSSARERKGFLPMALSPRDHVQRE